MSTDPLTQSDLEFDLQHLWHPYTSLTKPLPCYPVRSADGVYLELEDGRRLVDGMSSWWACIHGYNVPELNQAAHSQLEQMSHVMFGGITHKPAIELGKRLVELTPDGLDKVFISDSGSVAVEVALKMALQYSHARHTASGTQVRSKFISLRRGYHGDTFGAMSVTDPDNGMHELFAGFLPEQLFIDAPRIGYYQEWEPEEAERLEEQIAAIADQACAIILEPVVQGAGGMRIYHPTYLRVLRELCDNHDLLLIADEIATGFGRTGKLFACEHAGITPDILCVGKAITGGYMSLAATLTTEHVAEAICNGKAGVFMHGPTFMGNPLATRVASASLDLLLSSDWQARVDGIQAHFARRLPEIAKLDAVAQVRWLGAIGVVETHEPVDVARIQKQFVESGVWIRPFGKLVYMMPPYIIEPDQLDLLLDAIEIALK